MKPKELFDLVNHSFMRDNRELHTAWKAISGTKAIAEDELESIYVKNLFVKPDLKFVLMLSEGRIVTAHYVPAESEIRFDLFHKRDIGGMKLTEKTGSYGQDVKLVISFRDGREIELHSASDTNVHYQESYGHMLKEMFASLSK